MDEYINFTGTIRSEFESKHTTTIATTIEATSNIDQETLNTNARRATTGVEHNPHNNLCVDAPHAPNTDAIASLSSFISRA